MNSKPISSTIKLDGEPEIILETGRFAPQASGAVTARCGDTIVLAVVTSRPSQLGVDFLPMTIEYREKLYASGLIKSSRFVKREGRPSDEEILTSRLVDRSIRPVFPEGFTDEIQIVITPLSFDGQNHPETLSIIAASAALAISPLPFLGPVGAVNLGLVSAESTNFLINPPTDEQKISDLDLFVSGTRDSLTMIEAGANEVSETTLVEALKLSQEVIAKVIDGIDALVKKAGQTKVTFTTPKSNPELENIVKKAAPDLKALAHDWAAKENLTPDQIVNGIVTANPDLNPQAVYSTLFRLLKKTIRTQTLEKKIRPDGRTPEEIRPIEIEVGILPRTHGSALFKRGLTHALSIVTLASPAKEQLLENLEGETTKRYLHHYNMPPYSTGETGRFGWPSRREIGHGALAERALLPVLPPEDQFAYTIRIVSEIMSSNGSTSQASVCGSTLSLMDAGVPLKKPVAGIAMGLVTDGKGNFVTLSDISGAEDFTGDMDFKVAGTQDGITAIQMDVKTLKITPEVLAPALDQAHTGRIHILKRMQAVLPQPRPKLSQYAPRVEFLTIPVDKIGTLIGPGGKTIRSLQQEFSVEIDVEDNGAVSITGTNPDKVEAAKAKVDGLTAEVEVGKVYTGTIKNILDFGAFVEVLPGQEGLVHVSNMAKEFVKDPHQIVKIGDTVQVRAYQVDSQGRINLTMLLDEPPRERPARPQRSERRFGDRPHFSDRPRFSRPRR